MEISHRGRRQRWCSLHPHLCALHADSGCAHHGDGVCHRKAWRRGRNPCVSEDERRQTGLAMDGTGAFGQRLPRAQLLRSGGWVDALLHVRSPEERFCRQDPRGLHQRLRSLLVRHMAAHHLDECHHCHDLCHRGAWRAEGHRTGCEGHDAPALLLYPCAGGLLTHPAQCRSWPLVPVPSRFLQGHGFGHPQRHGAGILLAQRGNRMPLHLRLLFPQGR